METNAYCSHAFRSPRPTLYLTFNLCLVVTMYTTSSAQNAQHQWTEMITDVGALSYINIQTFRTFSGNTLTSISGNTLGHKAFYQVITSLVLPHNFQFDPFRESNTIWPELHTCFDLPILGSVTGRSEGGSEEAEECQGSWPEFWGHSHLE